MQQRANLLQWNLWAVFQRFSVLGRPDLRIRRVLSLQQQLAVRRSGVRQWFVSGVYVQCPVRYGSGLFRWELWGVHGKLPMRQRTGLHQWRLPGWKQLPDLGQPGQLVHEQLLHRLSRFDVRPVERAERRLPDPVDH